VDGYPPGGHDPGPGIGHRAQHPRDAEGSWPQRAGRWGGYQPGDAQAGTAAVPCLPPGDFFERRIEEELSFRDEFDKAFISFTLHGFEDEDKGKVLANAHRALKPGGIFWILDFNEFDLDRQWFPFRWAFRRFECELAGEFLSLDLKEMLTQHGFGSFVTYPFLWGYVRMLGAQKLEV